VSPCSRRRWLLWLAAIVCAPTLQAAAAPVTTLLPDLSDIRRSTLVGASGQLYEPTSDGSAPRWVRRTAGGVSANLVGAARLDGEIVAAGSQTPLFQQREQRWTITQLGQRGRVVLGTGTFFSVAIGRQIFIRSKGKFLRIGAVAGTVSNLWAASESVVLVATDQGIFRKRGASLVLAAKIVGVLGFTGAAPYAVTVDSAINLKTGARTRLPGPALAVVRSATSPAAILRLPSSQLGLATDLTSATIPIVLPFVQPPTTAAIDAAGRALLTTDDGVSVYDGTTWSLGTVADELPPSRAGPPPALSQ
jgi:hypothetical protein